MRGSRKIAVCSLASYIYGRIARKSKPACSRYNVPVYGCVSDKIDKYLAGV